LHRDARDRLPVAGARTAKIWFWPVALERSRGYADPQIGQILRIAGAHEREWLVEWEKRCGSD
jgi:hypothetical protein